MRKSVSVGISHNKENVVIVNCPCPGSQNFSRKNDRPALANIQGGAPTRQRLTVDYSQKVTPSYRSKSTSCCSQVSTHQIKPSPGQIRKTPCAESTRQYLMPPNVAKSVSTPQAITSSYRSKSTSCSQVSTHQIKPSPGQIRKTPCAESTRQHIMPPNVAKVYSAPQAAAGYRSKSASRSTQGLTPIMRSSGPMRVPRAESSKPYQKPSMAKFSQPDSAMQTGRSCHCQTSSCVSQLSTQIKPLSFQKRKTSCSGLTRQMSSNSACVAKVTPVTQKAAAAYTSNSVSRYCSPVLTMRMPSSGSKKTQCAESTTLVRKMPCMAKLPLPATVTIRSSAHNSTESTLTFNDGSQFGSRTLKDNRFYTLSQDTLKTTISSELDSMVSTMGKVALTRDTSIYDVEGKSSFIDAPQYFHGLDHGTRCSTMKTQPIVRSPYILNLPFKRSNSVSSTSDGDGSRKPAVKSTLKRRSSLKNQIIFPLLYSPEYIEELISYCYMHKENYILRHDWVEKYVDKRARTNIMNWLLQVSGFIVPKFEPVYYMAVRLFDFTVIGLKLRHGHYQLGAVIAFWISMKFLDDTILLKVPKVYSLCNGKYSKAQILSMERKILKSIGFCLNICDPLDFLYNYLKLSSLENDELLEYGAKFVLECATLFETYSLVEAPFLAASSLYLAYQILRNTNEVPINFIWYTEKNIHHYVQNVLKINVKYAVFEKYEPLARYMTPEKLYVAASFNI